MGQTKEVHRYNIIVKDSVEERMVQVGLIEKLRALRRTNVNWDSRKEACNDQLGVQAVSWAHGWGYQGVDQLIVQVGKLSVIGLSGLDLRNEHCGNMVGVEFNSEMSGSINNNNKTRNEMKRPSSSSFDTQK